MLYAHGRPIEYVAGRPETPITTIYFDTPSGTWSTGRSQTKLRARSYQNPDEWWFELKRREGTRVDKWRRPMTVRAVLASLSGEKRWNAIARAVGDVPLIPLFGVRCRRTAFEWVDLRVTIDRDLTFFEVADARPLSVAGRCGYLAGLVAEVKHEGDVPRWLADALDGHRARGYSKSRYALALRDGLERPFLVAEAPARRPPVATARL